MCTPDDGWKYHPKYVEQFTDINKLCNVASCWIFILNMNEKYFETKHRTVGVLFKVNAMIRFKLGL